MFLIKLSQVANFSKPTKAIPFVKRFVNEKIHISTAKMLWEEISYGSYYTLIIFIYHPDLINPSN